MLIGAAKSLQCCVKKHRYRLPTPFRYTFRAFPIVKTTARQYVRGAGSSLTDTAKYVILYACDYVVIYGKEGTRHEKTDIVPIAGGSHRCIPVACRGS